MTEMIETPLDLEKALHASFQDCIKAQKDPIRKALERRDTNNPGEPVYIPLPLIQPDSADIKTMIRIGNEYMAKLGEDEGWKIDVLVTPQCVYWFFDSIAPEGAVNLHDMKTEEEDSSHT